MHVREHSWQRALIALEAFHVLFLLTHDWLPLAPFNDIAGVRSQNTTPRLIRDTLINTLPMAILLGISLRYADRPFPRWLKWLTAILYGVFFAGELQAWWIPYFFGTTPDRIARYRAMFGKTHAFLPERNGIVPNTMHVVLHSATLAALLVALRLVTLTAADARQPAHGARMER